MTVTVEDLKEATFKLALHGKAGDGGFMYLYTCEPFPRLEMLKLKPNARAETRTYFFVDNQELAADNLQAVADRLNATPEDPQA